MKGEQLNLSRWVPGAKKKIFSFIIDNHLIRIYSMIEIVCWTGLEPWEFESPLPGSLKHVPSLPGADPLSETGSSGDEEGGGARE